MDPEKYKQITKWFNDNFEDEVYLKGIIANYFEKVFRKLPSEYLMEYADNPNLVIVNESVNLDSKEPHKIETLLNPFFTMFIVLSCKATYDTIMKEINKDKKVCSNCLKENPNEAKHCMECGTKF
ncbi:hypothetical protein BH18THE1_BH18THE1_11760 [soil metagenome]